MNVALTIDNFGWQPRHFESGLVAILPIHDRQTLDAINQVWPLVARLPTDAIGRFVLLYNSGRPNVRLDWQYFSVPPTFHLSVT